MGHEKYYISYKHMKRKEKRKRKSEGKKQVN